MATPAYECAPERVIDLDFETRAERGIGFDPNIVLEQAVYAELSALARTAPEKARAHKGFRTLDPAARPVGAGPARGPRRPSF